MYLMLLHAVLLLVLAVVILVNIIRRKWTWLQIVIALAGWAASVYIFGHARIYARQPGMDYATSNPNLGSEIAPVLPLLTLTVLLVMFAPKKKKKKCFSVDEEL